MMPEHMKAMISSLHRLMTAQIARKRYARSLRGLVLLLRIRWRLFRTRHAKFDVAFFRKLELCGLAQLSRKSMEFDLNEEDISEADASSVSEIAVIANCWRHGFL